MRKILVTVILLLFATSAFAQEEKWKKELLQEVVKVQGQKMVIEEFGLIKANAPQGRQATMQVKLHSEAPVSGVISRDNFILFTSMFFFPIIAASGEYQSISEPIGNLDFEFNMYVTAQGWQGEIRDRVNNTSQRFTKTWGEIYKQ